jgi:hypothetical protein
MGPSERPDLYRILQVDPGAHPEVIRSAYRTLLRVLGKHPDLGGDPDEARTIIAAYQTLSDARRREAYDRWLRAHGAVPGRTLPADVIPPPADAPSLDWVRAALPEFRFAFRAPFARSFDLVLERPTLTTPRVYAKAYPVIGRADWPGIFLLCEALRVARRGLRPSSDTIVLAARRVDDVRALLAAGRRHSAPWSWNRTVIGVCTQDSLHVHRARIVPSSVLRRLEARLRHVLR